MSKLISIGNIIDYTWEHYTEHFKVLMRISMWLLVVTLLSIVINILTPGDFSGILDAARGDSASAGAMILGVLQLIAVTIVTPIVGMWVFLMILQVAKLQQARKSVNTKVVSRASWKIFLSYLWIVILKGLAVLTPLLLIVPGVVLLVYNTAGPQIPWLSGLGILMTFLAVVSCFFVVIYAGVVFHFAEYRLIFEGTRGMKALREAKKMVTGRFFAVFVRLLLPKLLFIIPILVAQILLVILITLLLPSFSISGPGGEIAFVKISQTVDNLISSGLAVLSTPLFILADYYIYDSLRKNAS